MGELRVKMVEFTDALFGDKNPPFIRRSLELALAVHTGGNEMQRRPSATL
jgi:hypothetical protein